MRNRATGSTTLNPAPLEPATGKSADSRPPAKGERNDRTSPYRQLIQQRRRARRAALQALFEIDAAGHEPGRVVDERLADDELDAQGAQYLRWLVSGVVRHVEPLNRIIARHAPEWPVEQLAIVDRNILRMALFELGAKDADTPEKVVINEAVELAKMFGGDSSPRFVNGVLGAALRDVACKLF